MNHRSLKLSILGLVIVAIGSIVVCWMGFPAGLLAILPGAIPHIIQIYRWIQSKP